MDIQAVRTIFDEIEEKTQYKDHIFRGESRKHEQCSSTLYRAYKTRIEYKHEPSSENPAGVRRTEVDKTIEIGEIQKEIIEDVIKHGFELGDDFWSKMQHYGGATNFIDFTKSFLIAAFFACDKDSQADGRIILQESNSEIREQMINPQIPQNRIIAQKSVFVKPPTGVFPVVESVTVPHKLKGDLRKYLKVNFDISRQTIYNDLHGYIQHATKKSQGQFCHVQYTSNRRVEKRVRLTPESWDKIKELSEKCVSVDYRNPIDYLRWIIEQHIYLCENLKGFEKSILPIDTEVGNKTESNEKFTIVLKKGQQSKDDPEGDPVYIESFGPVKISAS